MTWVRLDDQFPEHPKVVGAGAQATWLYVAGLCYCSRQLTDGRIPKAVVPRLTELRKPYDLAEKLVVVGLWDEEPGCYVVHDYLRHQRSKAQVEKEREAANVRQRSRRDKKRSHGDSRGEVRGPESDTPTEPELPPKSPAERGTNPRAQGTNPRAVAAKRERERLIALMEDCAECGHNPNVLCGSCTNLNRQLAVVS